MSGLIGSIEAISSDFDSIDPKDIRQGIKECINNENKILNAEKIKVEESQKVTMQKEIDSMALTDEIRSDMGEEIEADRKDEDLER